MSKTLFLWLALCASLPLSAQAPQAIENPAEAMASFSSTVAIAPQVSTLAAQPEAIEANKIYRIVWSQNENLFMTENSQSGLYVAATDRSLYQYWRFIPVGEQPHTFYVQNVVTKRYIGSCNLSPSSQSKITTSPTPTPYYVAKNPSARVRNAWYFSSTDCAHYADPSQSPRALNKDGASSSIITWKAGHTNVGSYWWLQEAVDSYEPRAFLTGKQHSYLILKGSDALETDVEGNLAWKSVHEGKTQIWWFDGVGNSKGYRIVSHLTGKALQGGTRYFLQEDVATGRYFFTDSTNDRLSFEGESLVAFRRSRNATARALQLYKFPCGRNNGLYLTRLTLSGSDAATSLYYPASGQAARKDYYVALTTIQAHVSSARKNTLRFSLNQKPHTDTQVWLYCDWDKDGIFETQTALPVQQEIVHDFVVPDHVGIGTTRFRLRITDNALTDADDDVVGQVFDGTIIIEKVATGISAAHPQKSSTPASIYDLRGCLLSQPQAGINIINGSPVIYP